MIYPFKSFAITFSLTVTPAKAGVSFNRVLYLVYWIYYNRSGNFYEVDESVYALLWRIKHGKDIEPYSVGYRKMVKDIITFCKEISSELHFEFQMPATCKLAIREYVERVARTYLEYNEFVQDVDCDWFFDLIKWLWGPYSS